MPFFSGIKTRWDSETEFWNLFNLKIQIKTCAQLKNLYNKVKRIHLDDSERMIIMFGRRDGLWKCSILYGHHSTFSFGTASNKTPQKEKFTLTNEKLNGIRMLIFKKLPQRKINASFFLPFWIQLHSRYFFNMTRTFPLALIYIYIYIYIYRERERERKRERESNSLTLVC